MLFSTHVIKRAEYKKAMTKDLYTAELAYDIVKTGVHLLNGYIYFVNGLIGKSN